MFYQAFSYFNILGGQLDTDNRTAILAAKSLKDVSRVKMVRYAADQNCTVVVHLFVRVRVNLSLNRTISNPYFAQVLLNHVCLSLTSKSH